MYALIEAALEISDCPWLGPELGRAQTVSTWGVLGYAIMSCASEREAIRLGAQYYQAAPSLMAFSMGTEGDRLRIQMTPAHEKPHLLPFCVEENLTGICAVASSYMAQPMEPLEIWVTYPRPAYGDKYQEYLGCRVKYEQSQNILWTRTPRDVPLKTSDPISAQLCLKLVEEIVEQQNTTSDLEKEVRRLLLKTPGEMPNMTSAAAELTISPRTLRRRLSELGTTYKQIHEDVRRDLAMDYIMTTHLNIDQIAHLVGYTETTNFRRAFRQWTGHPPRYYRDS
jgi:AraC-like DNA-binding protein